MWVMAEAVRRHEEQQMKAAASSLMQFVNNDPLFKFAGIVIRELDEPMRVYQDARRPIEYPLRSFKIDVSARQATR